MKVLSIAPYFPSEVHPSHGLFIRDQIVALRDEGVDVTILRPVPWLPSVMADISPTWHELNQLSAAAKIAGVTVRRPRYLKPPGFFLLEIAGVPLAMSVFKDLWQQRELFRGYDAIHAHGALPCGQAAALLSLWFGIPYVITIHGLDSRGRQRRGWAKRQAQRLVLSKAGKVVLVGKSLQGPIAELGVAKDQCEVVFNGVWDELRAVAAPADQKKWKDKFILLSVSNLIPTKGVDITIQALHRLQERGHRNIHLIVAGNGPEEDSLRALSQRLGVSTDVSFLGRLPHNRVMELMALCDVFVLPSWMEAFGIVYAEAMLHGKPAIGVNGQGPSQFIEHGKTGFLVPPKNVNAVTNQMAQLLDRPSLRRGVGRQAACFARESLTWQSNAKSMRQIFERVIQEKAMWQ